MILILINHIAFQNNLTHGREKETNRDAGAAIAKSEDRRTYNVVNKGDKDVELIVRNGDNLNQN